MTTRLINKKLRMSDTTESCAEAVLLAELIGRKSVTPDDAGCQDILIAHLEALGFSCETMQFGDVTNLWARRGTESPVLCFAGHTDVVPPGPDSDWDSNPFEAVIRDGNMFGRGAADMKGSLAAIICGLQGFLDEQQSHSGSIALLITSDEEGPAADGTKKVLERLAERGETIDWCVLGEPSSSDALGDTVRIGRRGSLSGLLTVKGTQGHVAYPQLADNPIRRFSPVLNELNNTHWDDGNDYFPPTSFEMVELECGVGAPNVIPGELFARFNFRYCTEWTAESLQKKVESILDSQAIDYELQWRISGEPFLTEPGALIEAVAAAVAEVTGINPELSTGGGTSDGRFISPFGADVVELGPVNATIHKVNEKVLIADLPRLSRIYRHIAETLLAN